MKAAAGTGSGSADVVSAFAPRANPHLLGHETAERVLLDALNAGRLPHAWLFGGPAGIGKATLAFRFARFVLAQGAEAAGAGGGAGGLFGAVPLPPDSLHVDPAAPVFSRIKAGGHADLLTVERQFDDKKGKMKQDIAVDDVRRVGPFLRMTSAEGGWRVVVIDGAERMNLSGQNAILKILEEPPAGALLLLVTENPGSLLPTIRSRCRRLLLNPLPEPTVAELLARYRPELPTADRTALARLGEGSIGRAMDLATAGGLELYRDLMAMLDTLPRLDLVAVHAFADKLTRKGGEEVFETVTALLVWWLERLVRARAREALPPEVVPGEGALMARLLGSEGWVDVWEKVNRLFVRADSANLDRKQVVLTVLLTIEAAVA